MGFIVRTNVENGFLHTNYDVYIMNILSTVFVITTFISYYLCFKVKHLKVLQSQLVAR